MKKANIAVLGATGVVGGEIIKILEERKFPFDEIKFLSSARSAGKELEFNGKKYIVEEAVPEAFDGMNIVLASAGSETSKRFADDIIKRGGVIVDNSSAFRMDKAVPLVIAGVNDEDIKKHKGIVANPNCSTSQLMLPLKPLHDYGKIKRMIVSTYQSVSGAGKEAIDDLREGTRAAVNNENYDYKKFTGNPIAFNLIPQIDVFCENGYTKEEMKVVNETRKILHLSEDVLISCTAVRTPVFVSHSEVVNIEFEKEITPEKAREILSSAYGVEVIDDPANSQYPTPVEAAGKDPVYVGRLRKDLVFNNGLSMWVVADNLRIGAALNTVRIAERLITV